MQQRRGCRVSEEGRRGRRSAAETIAEDTKKVVKEGEELAEELGEKAMAYLTPLKEKFGNLDSLKDKPEELKKAVADLIKTIEDKADDVELPESLANALATVERQARGVEGLSGRRSRAGQD